MQRRLSTILFLIGIVAVVFMLLTFKVSFAELWEYISRAGYWLVAAVLLWGGIYGMNALALRTVISGSGSCPIGFWRMWQIVVSGFALNTTVPVGGVGGEPYRVMELSRFIGVERATSSVVLFAMMHVFSHFWFWLTGIVVYIGLFMAGILPLPAGMWWMTGMAILLCLGGIWLFMRGYKYGLIRKGVRLLGRIPGLKKWCRRFEERHRESLQKIDLQIAQFHGQNRKAFFQCFFLEYFGRFLQCLEIFFILLIFGFGTKQMTGGYAHVFLIAFLILVFTSLFANLIGFIPLQLGGREGGFALSVAALGMTAELGLFIGIICRVREIIWATMGLIIMKLFNVKQERI